MNRFSIGMVAGILMCTAVFWSIFGFQTQSPSDSSINNQQFFDTASWNLYPDMKPEVMKLASNGNLTWEVLQSHNQSYLLIVQPQKADKHWKLAVQSMTIEPVTKKILVKVTVSPGPLPLFLDENTTNTDPVVIAIPMTSHLYDNSKFHVVKIVESVNNTTAQSDVPVFKK